MNAAVTTPWGRFPLPAIPAGLPRFHLRFAGPCAAKASAPVGVSSSQPTVGAGQFTDEGDLVDLPPFNRVASGRFVSTRRRVVAWESATPGILPPPQAPP